MSQFAWVLLLPLECIDFMNDLYNSRVGYIIFLEVSAYAAQLKWDLEDIQRLR